MKKVICLISILAISLGCGSPQVNPSESEKAPRSKPESKGVAKIAFISEGEVYTINADGTGKKLLSGEENLGIKYKYCYDHIWSRDGKKIAFATDNMAKSVHSLHVMDADGTNHKIVTKDLFVLYWGQTISWSPDGKKLAYVGRENYAADKVKICVIDADGTNEKVLKRFNRRESGWSAFAVSWSPKADRIALVMIGRRGRCVVNLLDPTSGEEQKLLNLYHGSTLGWSSCGGKLLFTSKESDRAKSEVSFVDVKTKEIKIIDRSHKGYHGAVWFHNGKKILFLRKESVTAKGCFIYSIDIDGTNKTKLTEKPEVAMVGRPFLSLSPDDKKMTFVDLEGNICTMDIDGKNKQSLTKAQGFTLKVHPEGRRRVNGPIWQPK